MRLGTNKASSGGGQMGGNWPWRPQLVWTLAVVKSHGGAKQSKYQHTGEAQVRKWQ